MGAASSRKILCEPRELEEGRVNSKWKFKSIFEINRLVRDQLRQEVQCGVYSEGEVCDRVPIIQEPPKSVQQEDV